MAWDFSTLNEAQKACVLSQDRSLLVLAGAGSGKTRVLTQRIAYLIREKGVAPWSILAFTFTKKAAGEMQDRVAQALGDAQCKGMWIGTFHSLCARFLRREIDHLGYDPSFTIYDGTDQQSLIKQIMKSQGLSPEGLTPRSLLSRISLWKNEGTAPKQVIAQAETPLDRVSGLLYRQYEKAKKKNNALDFDDLILTMLVVMKQVPEVREKYRQQFSYLFVDEYQDTNHAQYDLVRAFAGPKCSVFLVGDADQSIYGWRGADIQNILHFEDDFPEARIRLLEQNYRSSKRILAAANALIENNQERKKKKLWTENPAGLLPQYRLFQSDTEEAYGVVQQLEEEGQKRSYGEMAVLYRTNAQSRPLEEALMRAGVPYRMVGGLKFYDRAEIKDLVAYMNLLVNPTDDIAFQRVINQPKRGIGPKSLEELRTIAQQAGTSLLGVLEEEPLWARLSPGQQKKFGSFRSIVQALRPSLTGPMTDFFQAVYEKSGYRSMLEASKQIEDVARRENVSAFYDAIAQYQEEEPEATIRDYLQDLSLLTDLDKTAEGEEAVTLMTMHAAKGLEFPCVFIVGMEDGLCPSERAMEEGQLEEERRLLYVAITRAEQKLFLSGARLRRVFGSPMSRLPSRFLDELEDYLELVEGASGSPQPASESAYQEAGYARRGAFADPRIRSAYDRQRARIRQMVEEKKKRLEASLTSEFRVGDRIRHKKFGVGTVVAVAPKKDGDELTVSFENKGIKQLNAALAPIRKES